MREKIPDNYWNTSTDLASRYRDRVALAPTPSPVRDKWLLSSALQKLIRRGEGQAAVAAALALHGLDPAYLRRRLPIIAVEDVGIGDLSACADVLALCSSAFWWEPERGARTISIAVCSMSDARKSRAACDALCWSEAERSLGKGTLPVDASARELIDVACDGGAELLSRIDALRTLGGLTVRERGAFRTLRKWDRDGLLAVARELALPPAIEWLLHHQPRTASLAALLPIVYEMSRERGGGIRVTPVPTTWGDGGVPLCAVDQYTSLGRLAIRRLAHEESDLRESLLLTTTARRVADVLGLVVFQSEGCLLDREVTSDALSDLKSICEARELQAAGMRRGVDRHDLYSALSERSARLASLRAEALQRIVSSESGVGELEVAAG